MCNQISCARFHCVLFSLILGCHCSFFQKRGVNLQVLWRWLPQRGAADRPFLILSKVNDQTKRENFTQRGYS